MNLDDKRIDHLRNLGETREIAIINFKKRLKENPDIFEIAEITDSHMYRDGGLLNKSTNYVAGICGSREPKNEGDLGEDVYSLVYFDRIIQREEGTYETSGTIYSNTLQNIVDYKTLQVR